MTSNKRSYNKSISISYDAAKNNANLRKHGVPLSAAVAMDWDDALSWPDERKNYGEARMCALASIDDRLYYVVYVDRGETRRVISLRKANSRELARHAED